MKTVLVLYHVFILIILDVSANETDGCPTNLRRDQYLKVHGDRCYEFVVHRHSPWQTAANDCGTKGGALVTVRNMADEQFIMNALSSLNFPGQGVWIGFNDRLKEDTFTWISGEPTDFTFWSQGQPQSASRRRRFLFDKLQSTFHLPSLPHLGPDEDCVLLKYTDSGHWHDYPCDKLYFIGLVPENFPYICEYPHQSTATTPPTTTGTIIG